MAAVTLLNDPGLNDKPIAGVVLYGNPYWDASESPEVSAGTSKTGAGTFAKQKLIPDKYKSRTQDYCNAQDLFCAGGYSLPVHLGYPNSPQSEMSINFAVSKLKGN